MGATKNAVPWKVEIFVWYFKDTDRATPDSSTDHVKENLTMMSCLIGEVEYVVPGSAGQDEPLDVSFTIRTSTTIEG